MATPKSTKPTLLDLLAFHEGVSAADLERALEIQQEQGGALAAILVDEGVLDEEELFSLMCGRLGCEVVAEEHLRRPAVTPDIRLRIPREEAEALALMPLDLDLSQKTLTVAMFDPSDSTVLERLKLLTGSNTINAYMARRGAIIGSVRAAYGRGHRGSAEVERACPLCAKKFSGGERFCPEHALPLSAPLPLADLDRGDLTGTVLERRYQLGGVLGRGGMGTVYLAENLRTKLRCAVKVLRPELSMDIKMRRRLFREIQASSQIRHPNVIEILDFGEDTTAGAFMVMEYLGGRSLESVMEEHGVLELPFAMETALQLCSALSAIHARGLVHCDLKPRNIHLLPSGQLKLLDFGLVKPFAEETVEEYQKITTGLWAFGTPCYMSPEQVQALPLDQASDIYSLGVVLYEMLLGHPPFEGRNYRDVLRAHVKQTVPMADADGRKVHLPSTLEVLLLCMLAKEPGDRPSAVVEISDTLRLAAEDLKLDLGRVELGVVAAARAPLLEPTRQTGLTMPEQYRSDDVAALVALARERRDQVVRHLATSLQQAIPHYQALDEAALSAGMSAYLDAVLAQLQPDPPRGLPDVIEREIASRSADRFSASELFGAFWIGFRACRPLLHEVTGEDLGRYRKLAEFVDHRALRFFLRMSEHYVATTSLNLARRGELLARQNEELLDLRAQLDTQLRRTHEELVRAERVKARVSDSISSGLVLVQLADQRVQLFNKAAERVSGLRAEAVLGRPIRDIFHLVEGMPFEEFVEQIRLHRQVGLRKLKLRFPNGLERTVYMRGEPFFDGDREQTGVLFVVEDVTEREMIIESFSRYVSREVAQNILRRGKALEPAGKPRRAVLLSVGIRGFSALIRGLEAEAVVELMDQYVRTVGNSVFTHGGVIDSVVSGRMMVYFASRRQDCITPVRAAIELCRRLGRLRAGDQQQALQTGIGLHMGEVLVINVGGRRRMVHTVLGEPTEVATALERAARPGEILLSPEVARGLARRIAVEQGPRVRLKSRDLVLKPVRVAPSELGR